MIDLVYKMGTGSDWDDHLELKYSIRSAVKYFKDLRNIIIVGHKPYWLTNVIHITNPDCYTSNKDANLINKLILASIQKETSDEFLNMSDDYFFLKEIGREFFEIPYIENSHLAFKKERLTRWEIRLQRTVKVLEAKNLPTNCYETHMPVLINKDNYAHILLGYDYGYDHGLCGNTLYFNTKNSKFQSQVNNVLERTVSKQLNIKELEIKLNNFTLWNYTSNTLSTVIKQYLINKFPQKTKYET